MHDPTLDRLGGPRGVSRIVFRFYDLLLDSDRLRPFFEGVDMARLIEHQTNVALGLLRGNASVSRQEILDAHEGLAIDPEDFDELVALLRRSLSEHGVTDSDAAVLLRYYHAFRQDLTQPHH